MRLFVGIAAVACVALAPVPVAHGGGTTDPRPGDVLLGKSGGVAYVSDSDFSPMTTNVRALAACPNSPGNWRLTGGGFGLAGGADGGHTVATSAPSDLDDLLGDSDDKLDDFWAAGADVSVGTTVTSYAVCAKWTKLSHKRIPVDDVPIGERHHVAVCRDRLITGGGGSISTSDSYVSSMFPIKPRRWMFEAFDTLGGAGGMDNYVICARDRDLVINKVKTSVPAGASSDLVVASCASKRDVVGGGAKSSGVSGTLSLRASHPFDSLDADDVPQNGWAVRAYNLDPGVQKLTAYAICAG